MIKAEIRTACIDDAPQLVEFNLAMAKETENIELDPDTVAAGVRALFEHPERGFYVVADADGTLAGSLMITTEWSDWRDGLFWWIQSVYVRPGHRRQGVYRALYRFVYELSRGRPEVCGFRLYVDQHNHHAQETYRSMGMNRTGYLVYEASTR